MLYKHIRFAVKVDFSKSSYSLTGVSSVGNVYVCDIQLQLVKYPFTALLQIIYKKPILIYLITSSKALLKLSIIRKYWGFTKKTPTISRVGWVFTNTACDFISPAVARLHFQFFNNLPIILQKVRGWIYFMQILGMRTPVLLLHLCRNKGVYRKCFLFYLFYFIVNIFSYSKTYTATV